MSAKESMMQLNANWNRRGFLTTLGAAFGTLLSPRKGLSSTVKVQVRGFGSSGNPYEELGVTTVINCQGTMTMLGGSVLRPELETVMAQAGKHFVRVVELEVAA